jgi:hypothetical protein
MSPTVGKGVATVFKLANCKQSRLYGLCFVETDGEDYDEYELILDDGVFRASKLISFSRIGSIRIKAIDISNPQEEADITWEIQPSQIQKQKYFIDRLNKMMHKMLKPTTDVELFFKYAGRMSRAHYHNYQWLISQIPPPRYQCKDYSINIDVLREWNAISLRYKHTPLASRTIDNENKQISDHIKKLHNRHHTIAVAASEIIHRAVKNDIQNCSSANEFISLIDQEFAQLYESCLISAKIVKCESFFRLYDTVRTDARYTVVRLYTLNELRQYCARPDLGQFEKRFITPWSSPHTTPLKMAAAFVAGATTPIWMNYKHNALKPGFVAIIPTIEDNGVNFVTAIDMVHKQYNNLHEFIMPTMHMTTLIFDCDYNFVYCRPSDDDMIRDMRKFVTDIFQQLNIPLEMIHIYRTEHYEGRPLSKFGLHVHCILPKDYAATALVGQQLCICFNSLRGLYPTTLGAATSGQPFDQQIYARPHALRMPGSTKPNGAGKLVPADQYTPPIVFHQTLAHVARNDKHSGILIENITGIKNLQDSAVVNNIEISTLNMFQETKIEKNITHICRAINAITYTFSETPQQNSQHLLRRIQPLWRLAKPKFVHILLSAGHLKAKNFVGQLQLLIKNNTIVLADEQCNIYFSYCPRKKHKTLNNSASFTIGYGKGNFQVLSYCHKASCSEQGTKILNIFSPPYPHILTHPNEMTKASRIYVDTEYLQAYETVTGTYCVVDNTNKRTYVDKNNFVQDLKKSCPEGAEATGSADF